MKLKVRRSQKSTMFRGTPVFQLQAVVDTSAEERGLISKYGLGAAIVYTSEEYQNNLAIASSTGRGVGVMRGLRAAATAALNLKITINDLLQGKQVECKSLEEMLGTEDAIVTACQNLKSYLETALTFDGREVLIDI